MHTHTCNTEDRRGAGDTGDTRTARQRLLAKAAATPPVREIIAADPRAEPNMMINPWRHLQPGERITYDLQTGEITHWMPTPDAETGGEG